MIYTPKTDAGVRPKKEKPTSKRTRVVVSELVVNFIN